MSRIRHNEFDSFLALGILALMLTSGLSIYYLVPFLEDIVMHGLHISAARSADVLAAEMFGITLGTIPVAVWINRFSWRRALYVSAGIIILMNLASALLSGFGAFLTLRFICGFAAGIQLGICNAVIGMSHNPARGMGYCTALQLLAAAVVLTCISLLPEHLPPGTVYVILAGISAVLLAFIRVVPEVKEVHDRPVINAEAPVRVLGALGLVAVFLMAAGAFGVWSFYELIGKSQDIGAQLIDNAISGSNFFGFAGALAAMCLAVRWGLVLPLMAGFGCVIFSFYLLLDDFTPDVYLLSGCLFGGALYFVRPYVTACIARIDGSGSLVVLTGCAGGFGAAIAPVASDWLHEYSGGEGDYAPIILAGIISMGLALLLILRLTLLPDREWSETAPG